MAMILRSPAIEAIEQIAGVTSKSLQVLAGLPENLKFVTSETATQYWFGPRIRRNGPSSFGDAYYAAR
jgi:hypothetical protein